jgi:hypothetical protein
MSDRTPEEEDVLEQAGEGEGEPITSPEGGGGAFGDESFAAGGPRGQDAERGEYYEPESERESD